MLKITEKDLNQIRESLRSEYDDAEISDMLKDAKMEKSKDGITVNYRNGAKDVFLYTSVLMHDSDLATLDSTERGEKVTE